MNLLFSAQLDDNFQFAKRIVSIGSNTLHANFVLLSITHLFNLSALISWLADWLAGIPVAAAQVEPTTAERQASACRLLVVCAVS